MGLGEHGDVFPLLGILVEQANHLIEQRQVSLVERVADEHRHRSVVDVLRRESEMDELLILSQAKTVELLLYEIFHRFHVVVGYAFDILHALRVVDREFGVDVAQLSEECVVNARKLRQRKFAEGDKIFDFNFYAIADQRVFRIVIFQNLHLAAVTAVDWRYGCQ